VKRLRPEIDLRRDDYLAGERAKKAALKPVSGRPRAHDAALWFAMVAVSRDIMSTLADADDPDGRWPAGCAANSAMGFFQMGGRSAVCSSPPPTPDLCRP
jgi:hypothetical protein